MQHTSGQHQRSAQVQSARGSGRIERQVRSPGRAYLHSPQTRSSTRTVERRPEERRRPCAHAVGLRAEYAELAGSVAAEHYQVAFVECRRRPGNIVARILPDPSNYECPITGDGMRDPVMLCDGHVYDRAAIEQWFTHGRFTSPLTNLEIPSLGCMPLLPLRKAIETFLNQRPEVTTLRAGEVQNLENTIGNLRKELEEASASLEQKQQAIAELELRFEEQRAEESRGKAEAPPVSPARDGEVCAVELLSRHLNSVLSRLQEPGNDNEDTKTEMIATLWSSLETTEEECARLVSGMMRARRWMLRNNALPPTESRPSPGGAIQADEARPVRRQAPGTRPSAGATARLPGRHVVASDAQGSNAHSSATTRNAATRVATRRDGTRIVRRRQSAPTLNAPAGNQPVSGAETVQMQSTRRVVNAARALVNREELIKTIFGNLTGADGMRTSQERLLVFAQMCGFEGTEEEWLAEYEAICTEYGSSVELGLEFEQFHCFMEDTEGSAFCSTPELRQLVFRFSESSAASSEVANGSDGVADSRPQTPQTLSRCVWSAAGWDRWPICVPGQPPQPIATRKEKTTPGRPSCSAGGA